jgi:hypothetical protein
LPDNIKECQERLLNVVKLFQPITPQDEQIVNKNIVCHDALTYDFEFKQLEDNNSN